MKSRAVWFERAGVARVREVDVSDPRPGEVQVRCVANGVCMGEVSLFTDVETGRWPLPLIPGHEGVGRVTKVGAGVGTHREGDWVVCRQWAWDWNRPAGLATKLSGPPADATTFLAEPVECVVRAWPSYGIEPGDRVLVLGVGFMGLLNVQLLSRSPLAELVVVDLDADKLDLALRYGATRRVVAGRVPGESELDALEASPFDLVIECSGATPALARAQRLVREGGRLAVFAWHHRPVLIDLGELHVRGVTMLHAGPSIAGHHATDSMARAVRLIEAGVFDLTGLVTHRHRAEDVQTAMETACRRSAGYIKGVLTFQ